MVLCEYSPRCKTYQKSSSTLLFQPIRSKIEINRDLASTCFPALGRGSASPRAWYRLYILALVTGVCFPVLITGVCFPALGADCLFSRRILIGSLRCCVCCDWLLKPVITKVYLFGPFPLIPVMDTGSGSFLLSIAWTL